VAAASTTGWSLLCIQPFAGDATVAQATHTGQPSAGIQAAKRLHGADHWHKALAGQPQHLYNDASQADDVPAGPGSLPLSCCIMPATIVSNVLPSSPAFGGGIRAERNTELSSGSLSNSARASCSSLSADQCGYE
jgi:hypothetical protein